MLTTESNNLVAQLTATDVDTDASDLTYSIAGGADASRFSISSTGLVSFLSTPFFSLPVDADANNIYQLELAVSDGTSTTVREVQISVIQQLGGSDLPQEQIVTIDSIEPIANGEPANVLETTESEDLASVLAIAPVVPSDLDDELTSRPANSLSELALPVPIVVDSAVVDSIAIEQVDDVDHALPDSDSNLLRKLLLDGASSPAKISLNVEEAISEQGLANSLFVEGLNAMRQNLDDDSNDSDKEEEIISSVAVGVTATLTVGFIGWVLRAGTMLVGFLSSAPLWRHLDPMAFLAGRKNRTKDQTENAEDQKLDHLFRRGSRSTK